MIYREVEMAGDMDAIFAAFVPSMVATVRLRKAERRAAWLGPLCLVAWLVLVACVWAVAR